MVKEFVIFHGCKSFLAKDNEWCFYIKEFSLNLKT
jgi:hypothetical protein